VIKEFCSLFEVGSCRSGQGEYFEKRISEIRAYLRQVEGAGFKARFLC